MPATAPCIHALASINIDLTAYVEALPRPGETVLASSLATSPGGKGLNQAVAAARLGARVHLVGCIGDDDHGRQVAAFLAAEGLDLAGLETLPGVPTGLAMIAVDRGSQNAIVVIPGANMAWPERMSRHVAPAAGDLVLAQLEIPEAQTIAAFAAARAKGAITILNPAPARPVAAAVLELADQLILNEIELPMVLGQPVDASRIEAVTAAARSLATGRQCVVATLGAAGAVIASPAETFHLPAEPVAAVDTTAAGDCFIGAWAAALAEGASLRAAAAFANRAAGVSVTRKGAALSLPRRAEIGALR